jgi:hypothetical protein
MSGRTSRSRTTRERRHTLRPITTLASKENVCDVAKKVIEPGTVVRQAVDRLQEDHRPELLKSMVSVS